jgi:hypothetical protein
MGNFHSPYAGRHSTTFAFFGPGAASGHIESPTKTHQKALTAAKLPHVSIHGLRRTFGTLAEWGDAPTGIVAQIMGHKPSAFTPLLADTYEDASDAALYGKPDSLIPRGGGYTFIELKDGVLNNYRTKAESTEALRYAYGQVFGRCGDGLSESKLSTTLYEDSQRGQILARDAAWNHSLFKVAALQAKHGYQRYLVVFKRNPSGKDAARYCKVRLVWCTLKTLPDFLRCIELMRHGLYIPFQFSSKNYSFTVTP